MAADTDLDTAVTVSNDEVTVEKSFEAEEFPVPAIKFLIRSTADEPVDLRLVDQIPESFPMESIGFHPDYENDRWTAYRDHRVEYQRTLEPGEEVLTVYGVRIDDPEEATAFLVEPRIERQSGEESDPNDILGRETNQVVRDALAGEDDSLGNLSEETDAPGDDAIEAAIAEAESEDADDAGASEVAPLQDPETDPVSLEDPVGEETTAAGETTRNGGDEVAADVDLDVEDGTEGVATDEEGDVTLGDEPESGASGAGVDATSTADAGSLASALATEIRSGNVPEEDLEVLREELDAAPSGSVEARVERLEGTVAELDAYTDALATFLDENGTGQQLVDDLSDQMETLNEEVNRLDAALSVEAGEREDLWERVEEIDASVTGVREDLRGEVDELEDDLEAGLEEQSTAVEDLSDDVSAVQSTVDDLEEDLSAVRADLDDVRAEVDEVDDDLASEVENVQERIESLEEELEDLRSFRDRLSDVLGG